MSNAEDVERGLSVLAAVAGTLVPGSAVVATAMKEAMARWLKRNEAEASDIFRQELLKASNFDQLKTDPDGTYVRMARYVHAARMGAAHTNLRLLARLVIYGDGSRRIEADEFLSLAQVIESLRPNELVVLAAIIRERVRREKLGAVDVDSDVRKQVLEILKGSFPEPEIEGLFGALQRTGFVYLASGYGGGGWHISPQLMRLEATVQFADAVAEAQAKK